MSQQGKTQTHIVIDATIFVVVCFEHERLDIPRTQLQLQRLQALLQLRLVQHSVPVQIEFQKELQQLLFQRSFVVSTLRVVKRQKLMSKRKARRNERTNAPSFGLE